MTHDSNYKSLVVESFLANGIKCILIVDDAFDDVYIEISEFENYCQLLESEDFRHLVSKDEMPDTDLDCILSSARALEGKPTNIKQLSPEEEEQEMYVLSSLNKIYEKYTNSIDKFNSMSDRYDIINHFRNKYIKEKQLKPLQKFLNLEDLSSIKIVTTGKDNAVTSYRENTPDIIFMDYYIDPPDEEIMLKKIDDNLDSQISIELLKQFMENEKNESNEFNNGNYKAKPSIVLMSGQDIFERVEPYIARLEKRITAVRIGVIKKEWIEELQEGEISVNSVAGNILLESVIGREFSFTVEQALKQWRKGVDDAIIELEELLWQLDRNDFAYLRKYRLRDEGQDFSDYIEWLLGESLRTLIDNNVNWTDEAFDKLNDKTLFQNVIRTHPKPRNSVSSLYMNTKIYGIENRIRDRFSFGDFFVLTFDRENKIRMIITPDCDLIHRDNEISDSELPNENDKKKDTKRVSKFLTVGGKLNQISEVKMINNLADQYIMLKEEEKHFLVDWDLKDIESHEIINENYGSITLNDQIYEFKGTLRTIFAQSIQTKVINDVSRIGLAVTPAIPIFPSINVLYMNLGGDMDELQNLPDIRPLVILPSGITGSKCMIYFDAFFVHKLIAVLVDKKSDLHESGKKNIDKILQHKYEFEKSLLEGIKFPSKFRDIEIKRKGECNNSWLNIEVNLNENKVD